MTGFAHEATQHVLAPADRAFAYLADPVALGRWSFGCFATEETETAGLHTGLSLFDGGRGWFRIETDPAHGLIDYRVGAPDRLVHRISARVMEGEPLGYAASSCLVTLMAWRPADMASDRWRRLCASHEAEIWLIKAQIESAPR